MKASANKALNASITLVLCAVAIEFCVSANLLTMIGVPYMTEGGAFPLKIHPGTYVLVAAYVMNCAAHGYPNSLNLMIIGRDRALTLYLAAIVACLLYVPLTTGKGNCIVLIDTFLPAGLAAMVLQTAKLHELTQLRRLLQWGIALNAVICLGEAATHMRLVPLYLNGNEYNSSVEEFRPTALYDHPLTGGILTMIGFALPPQHIWRRWIYTCLLFCAMLAFGGRVAVAATIMSWLFAAGLNLYRRLLRRDKGAAHLCISYFVAVCLALACLLAGVAAGLGTRLAGHLYWDSSAQVRLAQWHLIGELDASQILFGTTRDDLIVLLNPLWLNFGVEVIENFWLLMFVTLGVAGFSIFLTGFSSLLLWSWRKTDLRGRILLMAVLIVASTSNSLGRKSTVLVFLVSAICCVSVEQKRSSLCRGNHQSARLSRHGLIPV